MDFDRLPTRPVIKSIISAQAEWDTWLHENHFRILQDAEGLEWRLELETQQLPDPKDRHGTLWVLTLMMTSDVDVETFIRTGTLDSENDLRLIGMLRDKKIPLRMKPMIYEAHGIKEAKDLLARILPELRENIAESGLNEIKRGLIGRWLEGQTQFGAKEHGVGW